MQSNGRKNSHIQSRTNSGGEKYNNAHLAYEAEKWERVDYYDDNNTIKSGPVEDEKNLFQSIL